MKRETDATPCSGAWLCLLAHRKPVMLQGTKSHLPGSKAGALPTVSPSFTVYPGKCLRSLNNCQQNQSGGDMSIKGSKKRQVCDPFPGYKQQRRQGNGSLCCHCPCALCVLRRLKSSRPRAGGFDRHRGCWKVSNFYET